MGEKPAFSTKKVGSTWKQSIFLDMCSLKNPFHDYYQTRTNFAPLLTLEKTSSRRQNSFLTSCDAANFKGKPSSTFVKRDE